MSSCSSSDNLAERLGYPPGSKLLIIHADDLGTFHAVNEAFARGIDSGFITCGSINAPGQAFEEFAEWCRERSDVDIGVHITLSTEFKRSRMAPVLPVEQVRSLVTDDGFFHPWIPKDARPGEVAAEIRAQIRKVVDAGMTPTHVDTHMGTVYATAELTRIYIKAAAEFGLPAMVLSTRAGPVASKGPTWFPLNLIFRYGFLWRTRGMPRLDELILDVEWDKGRRLSRRKELFMDEIRKIKPGVTQFIIHPTLKSKEMPSYDGWDSFTANRVQDLKIFSDPEVRALIESEGVTLIGWRPIMALMNAGS